MIAYEVSALANHGAQKILNNCLKKKNFFFQKFEKRRYLENDTCPKLVFDFLVL